MSATITGGCQCGAVRYRIERLGRPSICHCRMCQKAFGAFYGPLVTAHGLEWTRGEPNWFQSSNKVRRGFCKACGTPLTYDYGGPVEVAIGSLDDPELAAPVVQVNPAEKLPFTDTLAGLPVRDDSQNAQVQAFMDGIVSYQHPDHDTQTWPPRDGRPEEDQ
ncbi:MAG: GFA family protein [Rhodobiaceae bacterium]|nr:GFA family protein [Rhodobiaceae bacterium]MCC0053893.1 GFA family protein [Rhodobiaceae bacterium]